LNLVQSAASRADLARIPAVHRKTNSENQPIRFQHSRATGPGLDVSLDFAPALLIAHLSGHLRADARKHLRDTFCTALRQRPERLVIDASCLVTCDAAGLAGLFRSIEGAGTDSVPVAVSGLAPVYRRMLCLVSSQHDLEIRIFRSLDEAVDQMLSMPGAPRPDADILLTEVRNLRRALLTRGTIDQAKGVLMVVYGLDSDAAFAMLVWYSRSAKLPLHELAASFLDAVRREQPGTLTIARADALLADLTYRPPKAGGRYA
jgi:anti-anti-sigma regulatory factor